MPPIALVVDDSMLVRHTVCRFLEERGYEVESSTNGAEALQMVGCVRPDLIITDMVMPRMTGSELISALKSNPTTAAIPIIIVAGRASAADARNETRAQYVIYKDIDIVSQLEKALGKIITSSVR
ncbi:MAG TPA: response regulator [Terriglobales bacterium]|nr:response regulator [Terriglobales bacterium]